MRFSFRNYFEVFTSLLFFVLGAVILVRSITETRLILGLVIGGAFLAYGSFRLRYVWNFLFTRPRNL